MARDFAKKFYNSKEWYKTRSMYAKSKLYLCEKCGRPVVIGRKADEGRAQGHVHHKIWLNENNINDAHITLGLDNLQLLCEDCHNKVHNSGERRREVMLDSLGRVIGVKEYKMLRACSYCGGIHEGECPKKPKRNYKREHTSAKDSRIKERKFRSSREWQEVRASVLDRDKHMCRVCLHDEQYISVHERLDVHHIEPLHKAWDKRKSKSNLITLCKRHHYEADDGHIKAGHLKKIISTPPTIGK